MKVQSRNKMNRRTYIGKNNPNFKNNKTHNNKCIDCKVHISYHATRCIKCYRKTLTGNGNPMFGVHRFGKESPRYIDGRKNKQYYCYICNKKISGYQHKYCLSCVKKLLLKDPKNHPLYGKNHTKESRKKNSLSHGGTGIPYEYSDYPKEFKIIRKNILKRDKQKCTICNKNAKIVHHIDYNKDNNLENNLITVCSHCHPKANVNIDYWYAYFKYIIREKGVSNVE